MGILEVSVAPRHTGTQTASYMTRCMTNHMANWLVAQLEKMQPLSVCRHGDPPLRGISSPALGKQLAPDQLLVRAG